MRFMSTRTHGAADYLVGVLLIAAPYLFGFANGGVAQWLPMVLGVGVILYSLLTRYELGAMPVIPMPAHLWLDGLGGALLLVSPWLFGFADQVWVPHVVVGLIEIGAALMTHTQPDPARETRPLAVSHRTGIGVAAAIGIVLAIAAVSMAGMDEQGDDRTASRAEQGETAGGTSPGTPQY